MEGSEFALTSALLAVLGSVVYFSWSGSNPSTQTAAPTASTSTKAKGNARRGKKRRTNEMSSFIPASTDHDDSAMETSPSDAKPRHLPPPAAAPKVVIQRSGETTIPGGLAPLLSASEMESVHSAGSSVTKSTQKKKKKNVKKDKVQESEGERMHPGGLMLAPPAPVVSPKQKSTSQSYTHETSEASEFDSGSGWTRVKRNKDRGTSAGSRTMESTSDAGVTTSVTEEEDSVASISQPVSATRERGQTLTSAERFLPKAAETKVDDMLDGPKPGIARVMRVAGSSSAPSPAKGLSWEDYEDGEDIKGSGVDADEEDSTWAVVGKRRGGTNTPSTYASDSARGSTSASATSAQTKKQRQNAARREAEKSAKSAAEREREAKLQQHRRELEKVRIAEAYQSGGGRNVLSGGQQAKVDSDGKLVWD